MRQRVDRPRRGEARAATEQQFGGKWASYQDSYNTTGYKTAFSRGLLSGLAVMFFAGDLALFEHDRRAEKDSNEAEGGKRNECNKKDGHRSLLT